MTKTQPKTSTTFNSSVPTRTPFLDILYPIAHGHRALIQSNESGELQNQINYDSFHLSFIELLLRICVAQPKDTLVVWVVVGSLDDANNRRDALKAKLKRPIGMSHMINFSCK